MQMDGIEESGNVEDRRGMKGPIAAGGGIGMILIAAVVYFVTGDANKAKQFAERVQQAQVGQAQPGEKAPGKNDETKKFLSQVMTTTEKVWSEELPKAGWKRYVPPKLVIFDGASVQSGCGTAPAEVGPFYCPADRMLYLHPGFFDDLERKLGGSRGQFSQAYVIAHEVGHHIQNLIEYSAMADAKRGTGQENEYSIRLELQADYLAGCWGHHGQARYKFIQKGDVESALLSAQQIGDDRIRKEKVGSGFAHPEKYNHGTGRQRVQYFSEGLKTGDVSKARLDRFFTAKFNKSTAELVD